MSLRELAGLPKAPPKAPPRKKPSKLRPLGENVATINPKLAKEKTCGKCGQTKPIAEFYFNNSRLQYVSKCKPCHNTYSNEQRQKKREWKLKNPKTRQQRRKEYITQCIKLGTQTRFALKSLFEDPIDGLRKCTKCQQFKPPSEFWKDNRHKSGYRASCKKCAPVKKQSIQTRERRKKETKIRMRVDNFLFPYLTGDGCCLYCGETEPFFLNNHHPWKKIDPDFTITLCENHHAPFTRKKSFILQDWH